MAMVLPFPPTPAFAQPMNQESLQEALEHIAYLLAASTPRAPETAVMRWETDDASMLTHVDEQWLAFRGHPPERELGLGWADGLHPDDIGPVMDLWVHSFMHRIPYTIECRMKHHSGEYRRIRSVAAPRYLHGLFVGYCGYAVELPR